MIQDHLLLLFAGETLSQSLISHPHTWLNGSAVNCFYRTK